MQQDRDKGFQTETQTEDDRRTVEDVAQWFGIEVDQTLRGLVLFKDSERRLGLVTGALTALQLPSLHRRGLSFVRLRSAVPTLTTQAARVLGQHATERVVCLAREQTQMLLEGSRQSFACTEAQCVGSQVAWQKRGLVLFTYLGSGVCLGFLPDPTKRVFTTL